MKAVSQYIQRFFTACLFAGICMTANTQVNMSVEQYIEAGDKALKQGNHKVAETSFKLAIQEAEQLGQTDNQILAMMKLKQLLVDQNRLSEAVQFAMNLCDFMEKSGIFELDDKLFEYGQIAIMLGKLHNERDALSCLEILRAVAQQIKTQFAYGFFNNTAAMVHGNLGKWDNAVKYYISASDCLNHSINPHAATISENIPALLAAAYYNAGDLNESYTCYSQLAKQYRDKFGINSRKYADAILWLANIEAYKGMLSQAKGHYMECWNILKKIVSQNLMFIPSNSRGEYWENVNDAMWRMAPFAIAANYNEDDFTSMAYESLMFSKGLLLSLEKSTKSIIEQSGNEELLSDYIEIENLRKNIVELQASGQGADATAVYVKMDSLDGAFQQRMQSLGLSTTTPIISPNAVIAALGKGEALIDYADFVKKDGTHVYAAFVVKHGMKHPKLIKVFEQSKLDSLVAENNGKYSDLYNDYHQESMYELLWKPLVKEMKGSNTLYFVPSGILNQIAVEAIKLPNREYIGDKYNIIRLSNAKEVIAYKRSKDVGAFASAAIYGRLEYDVNPATMAEESSAYEIPPLYAMRGATDSIKAKEGFRKLKMSGPEVIEISDILVHSDIDVRKYMDTHGTEESFVSMSGNAPDLLLLSTHGFYYSPENVPSWSSLNEYDNPMYLTGLVMSGGNAEYLGREIPDGVMGGLLTSSDISRLDLSKTKMVVLSACETGLGETTNEGVYGLQRAFKKAGAGTLVMSLWPVSDLATKDFMVTFHKELANNGWDRHLAFNNAKQSLRKKYSNPYYWAAFIMID